MICASIRTGRRSQISCSNRDGYRNARVIVAGRNFGCGSSRENAVWALYDYGIRAVIAPSTGDIFYNNSIKNGLLPIFLPEAVCNGLIAEIRETPVPRSPSIFPRRQCVVQMEPNISLTSILSPRNASSRASTKLDTRFLWSTRYRPSRTVTAGKTCRDSI